MKFFLIVLTLLTSVQVFADFDPSRSTALSFAIELLNSHHDEPFNSDDPRVDFMLRALESARSAYPEVFGLVSAQPGNADDLFQSLSDSAIGTLKDPWTKEKFEGWKEDIASLIAGCPQKTSIEKSKEDIVKTTMVVEISDPSCKGPISDLLRKMQVDRFRSEEETDGKLMSLRLKFWDSRGSQGLFQDMDVLKYKMEKSSIRRLNYFFKTHSYGWVYKKSPTGAIHSATMRGENKLPFSKWGDPFHLNVSAYWGAGCQTGCSKKHEWRIEITPKQKQAGQYEFEVSMTQDKGDKVPTGDIPEVDPITIENLKLEFLLMTTVCSQSGLSCFNQGDARFTEVTVTLQNGKGRFEKTLTSQGVSFRAIIYIAKNEDSVNVNGVIYWDDPSVSAQFASSELQSKTLDSFLYSMRTSKVPLKSGGWVSATIAVKGTGK